MNSGRREAGGGRRKTAAVFFFFFTLHVSLFMPRFLWADYVPGEILIKWKVHPSSDSWQVPGTAFVLNRHCSLGNVEWDHWRLPEGHAVEEMLGLLKLSPEVADASANEIRYPMGRLPNDPLLISQWHLDRIQAFGGWDFETGSSNPTTIAIIDTGVDATNIDLSSTSSKIWTNPVDLSDGVDNDGNGKIDDIQGWDFPDNDPVPSDCLGHGTLVASVAAARTDNGAGVAGVSWESKILPLKIFSNADCGSANSADIVAAIGYAVWLSTRYPSYTGRMVINMSLGCPASNACASACAEEAAEKDAIKKALDNGVLVIAAKGNCGNSVPVIPSDYSGVIGVGAMNNKDALAAFSSYGFGVDLMAPGTDILGAAKGGGFGNSSDDGTSFAAPQAAGAAALVWAILPTATTGQVQDILYRGADDFGDPGRDDFFGYGRINLVKTLRLARYGTLSDFDASIRSIAFPTLFRPDGSSRVTFSIPDSLMGSSPRLQIYDLSGAMIREMEGASWDGKNDAGREVASGVYLFDMKTERGRAHGRLIVDAQ